MSSKPSNRAQWYRLAGGLRILLAASLSSCFWFDENDTSELADFYQLVTTTDGNNFLYFDDPEWGATEPLLSGISATGTTTTHLAVCKAGRYYLFSLRQPTQAAVLASRIGPLTKQAF